MKTGTIQDGNGKTLCNRIKKEGQSWLDVRRTLIAEKKFALPEGMKVS